MQAYFETLREALDSEGVSEYWPGWAHVAYGDTVRVTVDDGSKYGRVISVYRTNQGRYERPVTYRC